MWCWCSAMYSKERAVAATWSLSKTVLLFACFASVAILADSRHVKYQRKVSPILHANSIVSLFTTMSANPNPPFAIAVDEYIADYGSPSEMLALVEAWETEGHLSLNEQTMASRIKEHELTRDVALAKLTSASQGDSKLAAVASLVTALASVAQLTSYLQSLTPRNIRYPRRVAKDAPRISKHSSGTCNRLLQPPFKAYNLLYAPCSVLPCRR